MSFEVTNFFSILGVIRIRTIEFSLFTRLEGQSTMTRNWSDWGIICQGRDAVEQRRPRRRRRSRRGRWEARQKFCRFKSNQSFRILISLEEITSAVGILFEKQKTENLREDEAGNDWAKKNQERRQRRTTMFTVKTTEYFKMICC